MQASIYASLDDFIAKHEQVAPASIKNITSERISNILATIISYQFPESTSFNNDYFRDVLLQVASTIMNVVYRQQQIFVNIDQIVTYTCIVQFLMHCNSVDLPEQIKTKMERYVYSLLYLQNCHKIKSIYTDSLNSVTIAHFYKSCYLSAFEFRYKDLMKQFGIIEKSSFLAISLLREIVQKDEFDVEIYESYLTSEWITISLVYFILTAKYESMKQVPVLSKILERYHSFKNKEYAFRRINGSELCQFYNNFVVDRIKKAEGYEVDRMIDETNVDHDIVSPLIVSPIFNENNTVLDNIIFSSSLQA